MAPRAADRRPLNVLIAGGGVAGLEAMLALKRLGGERVYVGLLAEEPQFWYRPLATAEPFGLGTVHGLDLADIADAAGAELALGRLASVNADRRVARTSAGAELSYDALLIAIGARPVAAVRGAFTFRGLADSDAFVRLLDELDEDTARRIVFALPGGVGWPLPLYELALQTAARFAKTAVEIVLVTHEEAPLELFGRVASERMAALLAERGIEIRAGTYPVAFAGGTVELKPQDSLEADIVVAMPRLQPPAIPGVPTDGQGFVPADEHGRVRGLDVVFAAGDITTFPVKQGGLAAQQADAAAETIAAMAGADIEPEPFRPVLRGLILTGGRPLYARAELDRPGSHTLIAPEALWWPPGKIVGRHLSPFLAERASSLVTTEYEKLPR